MNSTIYRAAGTTVLALLLSCGLQTGCAQQQTLTEDVVTSKVDPNVEAAPVAAVQEPEAQTAAPEVKKGTITRDFGTGDSGSAGIVSWHVDKDVHSKTYGGHLYSAEGVKYRRLDIDGLFPEKYVKRDVDNNGNHLEDQAGSMRIYYVQSEDQTTLISVTQRGTQVETKKAHDLKTLYDLDVSQLGGAR